MRGALDTHAGANARRLVLTVVCLATVAMSAVAFAQDPTDPEVRRLNLGLNGGAGYGRISTSEETGVFGETTSTPDDFTVGMAFGFEAAYLAKRNVFVEFVATGWTGTIEGALGGEDWSFGLFAGGFRWYPTGEGFYARGGFGGGVVTATLTDPDDGTEIDFDDYGLGLIGGVGYDVAITERFSVGPRADVIFVDVGDNVRALGVNMNFAANWR